VLGAAKTGACSTFAYMLTNLKRLLKRGRRKESGGDDFDRNERDRLTAEYTGSFVPNRASEYGITTKAPK
jgi:hypothetical protein